MKTIGFIGLGTMGEPMACNLIRKSGLPVCVFDLVPDRMEACVAEGAAGAESAQAVAEKADIVFTMLPKNEHVQDVYAQILPVVRNGQIFVEMSTISPKVSIDIANKISEKGALLLDAPVVKSKPAAISGTLGIYVGGDKGAYEEILPLLHCMGENVIHLGQNGNGLIMKLCHNMLVAQIQNGVNEMLLLAGKAGGIGPTTFAQAISYGGGQNFYLDSKAAVLEKRDFTPAFALQYMNKDIGLAAELCAQAGLDLEGVQLVQKRYEEAMDAGYGPEDFSATFRLFSDH